MNDGLSPDEARREAERRFGDVERTREHLKSLDRARAGQERRADWWNAASQDLRYALRGMRLKPRFALGVILTLGLGIGANAAMFGIVDRLLFRPPAFLSAPDRTHHIYLARAASGGEFVGGSAAYQRLLDIQQATRTMDVVGGYTEVRRAVGLGDAARELNLAAMTGNMWRLFDARPALGRFFRPDEDQWPNISHVVVLSYGYWQTQYNGAGDVLGKTMSIGPATYTIIGVAPRGFSGVQTVAPTAFIPITAAAVDGFGPMWDRSHAGYGLTWLQIYARRRPDVTMEAATADMTDAYRRSWQAQIALRPNTASLDVARPRAVVGSVLAERGPSPSANTKVSTWLLGVSSIVLLIACANVGNLLLARVFKRRREIAVRLALGISRARLVSQLLIESLLLSLLSAAAGLAIAQWGGGLLRATLMPNASWESTVADHRVLLFAAVCTLVTGLLAGLTPVLQATRSDVAAVLKAGPREGYGRRSRLRTSLLVMQAALSVVLLIGAGLFARSLLNVEAIRLGFDADKLVSVDLQMRGVNLDPAAAVALRHDLMDAARRDPAVENASTAITIPLSGGWSETTYAVGADSTRRVTDVVMQLASASYFATTGTRIIRGRGMTTDDRDGAPRVVVVSEAMARNGWPEQDPIGKCLRVSADTMPCRTVVGVAEDVKANDVNDPSTNMVYVGVEQGERGASLFIRVRGSAALSADVVRRELQKLMPGASYVTARPLSAIVAQQTRSWRLGATMFTVFGGLALLIAAIGLYSVVAYGVAQRTHEMGVRVALGARVSDVVMLVVRDGVRVVIVGVALGIGGALAGGRWLQSLLYHVSPKDPFVYGIVAIALMIVAVAASWLPAQRAARVDPSTALRAD